MTTEIITTLVTVKTMIFESVIVMIPEIVMIIFVAVIIMSDMSTAVIKHLLFRISLFVKEPSSGCCAEFSYKVNVPIPE